MAATAAPLGLLVLRSPKGASDEEVKKVRDSVIEQLKVMQITPRVLVVPDSWVAAMVPLQAV